MKVKRKVIQQGKTARALILPGFWLESFREQGHEIKHVWVELVENDNLLITPIIEESED
jgi:hypothetical protein